MVIIAVIGIIMILTTMNLQVSSDTLYTAKYINSIKKKETAYYVAKSAVNSARDYIKVNYSSDPKDLYDSLQSITYIEGLNIDTGDVKVTIEVQDLERKFCVNSIVEDETHIEYLKRILNEIGMNNSNVNKIADWIDSDEEMRIDGNENSIRYGTVKNAKIDSINELNFIDYFKEDIKEFKEKKVEGADNLDYYLSSFGISYPKININTANRVLLKSLTDDMTDQEVDSIIENRPIKDIYALGEIVGQDSNKRTNIDNLAGYTSKYFQIKANAVYDEEIIVITAVIDKDGSILFWGVE